jgi:hypothetical protein
MYVTLEILSGPRAGCKARLGTGQELRVGRTEWSDFVVPEDSHLSGVHFAVSADTRTGFVEDLGSGNGTFVNGRAASDRTALSDGDEILAGQTRFAFRVDADARASAAPVATPIAAAASSKPTASGGAPRAAASGRGEATYTVESCDSGLMLCRGQVDQVAPGDLAAMLTAACPLYLIVDFRKLGIERPPSLLSASYLFDWLAPPAAELVSPIVFAPGECEAWPAIVRDAWGNDGLICLFSRRDRDALVRHLRQSLRVKAHREDGGGGMLGYCWPSVMAMLLAHGPPRLIDPLVEGIEAVLVELPDLPQTWQLFGRGKVAELLDRAGLRREHTDGAVDVKPAGKTE